MRRCVCTVRTHVDVSIDFHVIFLPRVLVYIATWFDEAARTDLTRTLTRDWFRTTYGSFHMCDWRVSISLTIVDIAFTMEGLKRGQSNNALINVVVEVRR